MPFLVIPRSLLRGGFIDTIKQLHMTRVIIAHRPETIASADRVIVLGGAASQVANRHYRE